MSEESTSSDDLVGLARSQLEAVNRRDLDALMSGAAPDAVYDTAPSGMGVYEGHAAIRAFLQGYWDCFEELRFELEEADLRACDIGELLELAFLLAERLRTQGLPCDTDYERPDLAACPVTEGGVVCSLCCSLNNTCGDQCKKPADGPVDLATPTAERAPVGGS